MGKSKGKTSSNRIDPSLNVHAVASVIADIIKDYGNTDLHISDIITMFYERLHYGYPTMTREDFQDMINESDNPNIEVQEQEKQTEHETHEDYIKAKADDEQLAFEDIMEDRAKEVRDEL